LGHPVYVTGDYEADMKIILPHFAGVKGKYPEQQYQV
jgi:hypothetical protein